LADPLHTTRIADHPPFTEGGTSTITSKPYEAPKYPSVFIGRKPLRIYRVAAESNLRKYGGVWVEARGDLISRAILVALRVGKVANIVVQPTLGSVMLMGKDEKPREVPYISILLWFPAPGTLPTVVVGPNFTEPNTGYPIQDPLPHTGDPIPPQPVTVN
jgi:DNA-binding protein